MTSSFQKKKIFHEMYLRDDRHWSADPNLQKEAFYELNEQVNYCT